MKFVIAVILIAILFIVGVYWSMGGASSPFFTVTQSGESQACIRNWKSFTLTNKYQDNCWDLNIQKQ